MSAQVDSLERWERVEYAGSLINKQPDSALLVLAKLVDVGEKAKDHALLSKVANYQGISLKRKSNFEGSEAAYLRSIDLARLAGDSLLLAEGLYSLGTLYRHMGNFSEALVLLNQSLELRIENEAAPLFLARTYNGIGSVLHASGKREEAIKYFRKSHLTHQQIGNERYAASSAVNIGAMYVEMEQTDSAIHYLEKGLAYYREKKQAFGTAAALINLSEVYMKTGNLKQAKQYSTEALANFKTVGDEARIGMSLSSLAKIEQRLGNYQVAIDYARQSLEIAQKVGRTDNVRDQYLELSEVYADARQWKDAYLAQRTHHYLKDSLFNLEIDGQMQEQQAKFEAAEKDREIAQLKKEQELEAKQRQRLLAGLLISAGLALLAFLFYLGRRRAIDKLQKEQTVTRQLLSEQEKLLANLNQAQVSLVQSEKMVSLGQLTAGIAHEINNPINFITSSATALQYNFEDIQKILEKIELLRNGNGQKTTIDALVRLSDELQSQELSEETAQLISGINTGAERTLKIVNSLRIFSRNTTENFHPADLNEGIESTIALVRGSLPADIFIKTHFGELPPAVCQISRLNQVFLNIINNAVQALADRGTIQISTEHIGDEIKVTIEDDGPGIDAENHRRIFEPFFTTKAVGKGTGLGLSISYGIVEQHNGRIEVESEVGKGAAFMIWLPVVPANAENDD
ncbi:MAG: tetratricopeptide repeat protein [Bacteroidota bacterium]